MVKTMKRMQQRKLGTVATFFLTVFSISISSSVFANGGGGFGGIENETPVDKYYDLGESYFKSRSADGSRLEYCVLTRNSGLKKLSRRSVRSFRNGEESVFVDKLLHCDEPAVKIVEIVPDEERDAILYYLDKRFKLRLKNG